MGCRVDFGPIERVHKNAKSINFIDEWRSYINGDEQSKETGLTIKMAIKNVIQNSQTIPTNELRMTNWLRLLR